MENCFVCLEGLVIRHLSFCLFVLLFVAACDTRGRTPTTRDSGADTSIAVDSGGGDTASPLTCADGMRNGDETHIDCGGSCGPCPDGSGCVQPSDCLSMVCRGRFCLVAACTDAVMNGDETDVDCGGATCDGCAGGKACTVGTDCLSGECEDGVCAMSSCEDGLLNVDETDVDCGGPMCPACIGGEVCLMARDCESTICDVGTCTVPSCGDAVQNQDETSVDCGGLICAGCRDLFSCLIDSDCLSMQCDAGACVSCTDGVQNGNETGVDCGGMSACPRCDDGAACTDDADCTGMRCEAGSCISCTDTVVNGDETDVDCGGTLCAACVDGLMCLVPTDCTSLNCVGGSCIAPACDDVIQNQDESDVDCGGAVCPGCLTGDTCLVGGDCASGVCTGGMCQAPTCTDGVSNGTETGVDCGGPGACLRCPDFQRCDGPTDCITAECTMGFCGDTGCMPFPGTATDTFGYFGCTIPMTPATLPCPDIRTTGTALSLSDDSHRNVPIGFSFDFYGTAQTNVSVQSNGTLTFSDAYLTLGNICLPDTTATRAPYIALYWDDLDPGNPGGQVWHQTLGTAPNRQFVAQWDTERFSTTPNRVIFTAVLNEGSDDIQVCYNDAEFGSATYDFGNQATVGINNVGTDSLQFSCNTPDLSTGLYMQYIHP